MVRYIIAAALGCIYLAGSIWAVRSEGQAYRSSLSKTKLVAGEIENSSSPPPEATDKAVQTVAPVGVPSPRPEPPWVKPATAIADSSAKPALKPDPTAQPVAELAKAKPVALPPQDRAPGQPAIVLNADANPLAKIGFWDQPHLTKVWDVASLKPDDERRLGAELHDVIVQFNPLVDDGSLLARVEDAAEPFYKTLRRKEIKYRFFIVDSDAVNAFSHPGGYVYFSRGLFNLIAEDEDYVLQFAIGHEIVHVDLQHATRCLQDPDLMKMKMGTLQKLYWWIIQAGYLESDQVNHEFEADEWVARRMGQFGRTRREILIFLQRFTDYANKHGFSSGHAKPNANASPLENHYRAKTAARYRLKHLKEFMENASKTTK